MEFTFLDEVLPGISINLNALKRGTQPYSMLLYQHEGVLFASGERIGNMDPEVEQEKITSFIQLANEKNSDLVITPEYSCPWGCTRDIIGHPETWPQTGKLWVLACESIGKDEIIAFEKDHSSETVTIQFEHACLANDKAFLDPVVYLFTANYHDRNQLIVLIQFKTHHMGVWNGGDIERDHLIQGSHIYVLRNAVDSVHLITMICSEAMNLPAELTPAIMQTLRWADTPYLILNPQVNPEPQHPRFIAFRNFVFNHDKKEIISLNWNNRSKIMQHDLLRNGTSRSGIFVRSSEISWTDFNRIRKNHKLGLYYFYFGVDRHAYFLNSEPNGFLVSMLSVSIIECTPQQRMRNGPELIETYFLSETNQWELITEASDKHIACLASLGCTNTFLLNPANCVLEKERLVCISSGELLPKSSTTWWELSHLWSLRILENVEINRRMTFAEDQEGESQKQRILYVRAVNILSDEILPNKALYPDSIADLKSINVFLGFSPKNDQSHTKLILQEKFRYNLVNDANEIVPATVCYLDLADDLKVGQTFEFLQSMFDRGNMNRGRVIVFYKRGTDLKVMSDTTAANILTTNEHSASSFLK